jgi:hypothetical protein
MKRLLVTTLSCAIGVLAIGLAPSQAATAADVRVKKAIADSMTPEQLAAYKELLAARVNVGVFDRNAKGNGVGLTPGDTCTAATPEVGPLPYSPAADTTVGQTDNFDLPADAEAPTCTAASTCTGGGPVGSLPAGAIYTGTGTGPDRAYSLTTSANCNLTITMDPTSTQDLALILYQSTCSSSLADCVCVDDTDLGGVAESVALSASAGVNYFAVIDGYSSGATPPGPSGPFTLSVTGTGCTLVPVELLDFTIGD